MSDSTHLMTWVTRDTKARFAALAHTQGITESAFLKRLVDASLVPTTPSKPQSPAVVEPVRLAPGPLAPAGADTAANSRARGAEAQRRRDRRDRSEPESDRPGAQQRGASDRHDRSRSAVPDARALRAARSHQIAHQREPYELAD